MELTSGRAPRRKQFGEYVVRARSEASHRCRRTRCQKIVTVEMAKGFTLFMVKAVMSGRGDEVIDLARSNLWR